MKKGKAGLLSVLAIGSVAVIGFMAANEASNKNSRTISTTISAITTFESTSISSLDNTEYTTLFESNTTETYSEGTSLSSTYDTTAPEINEENSLISPSEQSELVPTIETTQEQETEEISASTVNTDTNIISVSEVVSGVNLVDSSTNQLRFHFIDVGQGDSTFIELPNGKSMLIDAGEIDQGDKVVAYIYEQGYDTVNYVVATHAHSDHIGGLPQVLSNFNVDEVIMTEDKNDTQIFSNLFTAIYDRSQLKYLCYHKSRGLCKCDGQSTYVAERVDNAVIEVIHQMFESIKGAPSEEILQKRLKKEMASNKAMQTKINLELKKNTNQLERLQEEIANTLTGDSVYTSEQLSSAIKTVEDRISTQKFQLEQLQNEATSKKAAVEQIRPMFEQFVGWSQEFDNCTIEQKRMIISQLVNRIELNKDYEITIELNMDYKDFCDDWDTLNTASTVVA